MDNMKIWNLVKYVPKDALKEIQAGRLKGKTDISPQWRMQIMTEVFGPCGINWKYEITGLTTIPGANEELLCFAQINLYVKIEDKWSDPIPGLGGSKLISKESAGLHNNDDGYKMAITDALSVAMKALGVAAEIYLGHWDGSKYRDKEPEKPPRKKGDLKIALGVIERMTKTNEKEFISWRDSHDWSLEDHDKLTTAYQLKKETFK